MSGERLIEVLLIGRDHSGQPRVIDLSGITIELVVPAPQATGGTSDLARRLQEAHRALEHYATEDEAGRIAREALTKL